MGSWQRRWTLWLIGGAAAMTMLFGGMVVVLYHLPGMQEPSFETDKALLLETRQRLTGVLAEFDALPLPDGVTGEDAEYSGCGTESGGLYQPSAFRELIVPSLGAVPAAVAVAEALQGRGWVVSPDTSHGYKIEADRGRWSLTGRVDAARTGEAVWMQARIDGAEPCHLDSE